MFSELVLITVLGLSWTPGFYGFIQPCCHFSAPILREGIVFAFIS